MLALKALVIGMGVLIVAGIAVIGVTLVNRMSPQPGPIASLTLDEPQGTRITSASLAPDRMAITLQGGGPDRIALVDTKTGHLLGHVSLPPVSLPPVSVPPVSVPPVSVPPVSLGR